MTANALFCSLWQLAAVTNTFLTLGGFYRRVVDMPLLYRVFAQHVNPFTHGYRALFVMMNTDRSFDCSSEAGAGCSLSSYEAAEALGYPATSLDTAWSVTLGVIVMLFCVVFLRLLGGAKLAWETRR